MAVWMRFVNRFMSLSLRNARRQQCTVSEVVVHFSVWHLSVAAFLCTLHRSLLFYYLISVEICPFLRFDYLKYCFIFWHTWADRHMRQCLLEWWFEWAWLFASLNVVILGECDFRWFLFRDIQVVACCMFFSNMFGQFFEHCKLQTTVAQICEMYGHMLNYWMSDHSI